MSTKTAEVTAPSIDSDFAPGSSPAEQPSRRRSRLVLQIVSVIALLAVWEVASRLVPFKAIVSPGETLGTIWHEIAEGGMVGNLGWTMRRVAAGFGLSMLIGTLLGLGIGAYRALDALFSIWVTVFITVPGLIWLVLGYVAFGIRGDVGAIFGVVTMVTPTVMVTIIQGTRALDRHLIEMARSFDHPTPAVIRRVALPQLLPYMFSAARYSLALTWHMVLFAEIIGRPNGFGFEIFFNYQISRAEGIWAYGIAFVLVALALEYGLMGAIQRRLFRWRPEARI